MVKLSVIINRANKQASLQLNKKKIPFALRKQLDNLGRKKYKLNVKFLDFENG